MDENKLIRGDFDKSCVDGPRLLLVLNSAEDAFWLREIFVERSISVERVDLLASNKFKIHNVTEFFLQNASADKILNFSIKDPQAGTKLLLSGSADAWIEAANMLTPFCEGRFGHQYLAGNSEDQILFEISLGEGIQIP